jgi:hypothetical protein
MHALTACLLPFSDIPKCLRMPTYDELATLENKSHTKAMGITERTVIIADMIIFSPT